MSREISVHFFVFNSEYYKIKVNSDIYLNII